MSPSESAMHTPTMIATPTNPSNNGKKRQGIVCVGKINSHFTQLFLCKNQSFITRMPL